MPEQEDKRIVIIIGPPGAGKGTQASLLADKLNLYYFETSKIIEKRVMKAEEGDVQEVEGKKYPLLKEKQNWEQGDLCSPPLVSFWVKQEINKLFQQDHSIVFAGSPRTMYEAQEIIPLLEKLYGKDKIKIALFNLKAKDSIWRNSHRRICKLMRHPIIYNEETKDLTKCPLDGSALQKRGKLDEVETIKIRLKEYQEKTLPMIDYFKEEGFNVGEIDAGQSPAEVFQQITAFIA